MELYGGLFDSMLGYCEQTWLRRGPVHTVSLIALTLASSLNIVSASDLLWAMGFLGNPLQTPCARLPSHGLCGLIYAGFLLNVLLARRHLCAVASKKPGRRSAGSQRRALAPAYLFASALLFTLTTCLIARV